MTLYHVEQIRNFVSCIQVVRPDTSGIVALVANDFGLFTCGQHKRKAVGSVGLTCSGELAVTAFIYAAGPYPTSRVHVFKHWSALVDFCPEVLYVVEQRTSLPGSCR